LVAVLIDHATKLAAHYLLPFEREVVVWPGGLSVVSALNETSGTLQDRLFEEQKPATAIAYLVMAAIAFLLSRSEKRLCAIFIGIAISTLVAGILASILPSRLNIDPFDFRMFYVFTLLTFVTILCYISRQWYFRAGFGLILGGTLGNLVSIFYPPFRVVDFIYIPTLSSARLFAPFFNGTYIFNVADVCICGGTLLVHLAFVSILLKKLVVKVARESVLSLDIEEWRIPSRITFRYVSPAVALSCICGVVALSLTDSLRNLQHRFVDGSTYQGEWLDGEFHGRGTEGWTGTEGCFMPMAVATMANGRQTNGTGSVHSPMRMAGYTKGTGKRTRCTDPEYSHAASNCKCNTLRVI
jgi:lipoprotein signal peptidase